MIPQNHQLKTDPEPFRDTWQGRKTAEMRQEDNGRLFTIGDVLTLKETLFSGDGMQRNPKAFPLICTGRTMVVRVRHVVRRPYVRPGYAMLSIAVESKEDRSSHELPGYLRKRLLSLTDPVLIRTPRCETTPSSLNRDGMWKTGNAADFLNDLAKWVTGNPLAEAWKDGRHFPEFDTEQYITVSRTGEPLRMMRRDEFERREAALEKALEELNQTAKPKAPEPCLFPAGRHYRHKAPETALGASSLYGAPLKPREYHVEHLDNFNRRLGPLYIVPAISESEANQVILGLLRQRGLLGGLDSVSAWDPEEWRNRDLDSSCGD